LLLLATTFVWMNCNGDDDDNGAGPIDPNDPSTFIGNYDLVSVTAKTGDLFGVFTVPPGTEFEAGQPTDIGGGFTITLDGTLSLTADNFTISIDGSAEIPNVGTQPISVDLVGDYEISGDQFTFTIEGEDPETGTLTVSGSQVTIETDDLIIVINKQ